MREPGFPAGALFDSGQAELRPGSEPYLLQLLDFIQRGVGGDSTRILEVIGHTDDEGDAESNQVLSERRALAVRGWLSARLSPTVRVRAFGLGESQPVATNDTAEGKARNRRVEVTISGPRACA